MSGTNRSALFLTPTVPSPTGNGLAQRCQLFLNALARQFDVTVLVLPVAQRQTQMGFVERQAGDFAADLNLTTLPGESVRSTHLSLIFCVSDPVERSAAFAQYGLPSMCAGLTDDCVRHCIEALDGRSFDHVHVMRSYCGPFGAKLARQLHAEGEQPVLTLDLDEDDAAFNLMVADHLATTGGATHSGMDSAWCRQEAAAYSALQRTGLSGYQALFASSDLEAKRMSSVVGQAVHVAANVAHCPVLEPKSRAGGGSLLFVGDFAHVPNFDGLNWFLDSVWPQISASMTDLEAHAMRLKLVGKNPPMDLDRLKCDPRIEVVGAVDSVLPYYATADLVIAPLRLGAGTRIKLLETARLGVPFVATSLAAEGLGMVHEEHCWIADTPADFARCVAAALSDPAARLAVARNAQALAGSKNTPEQIEAKIKIEFAALLGLQAG